MNKNEGTPKKKKGKGESCYYRFCCRLIPFEKYYPSNEQMETAFKVYPSAYYEGETEGKNWFLPQVPLLIFLITIS